LQDLAALAGMEAPAMSDDRENTPYPEIYKRLARLCAEGRSGTLFLSTPDNHAVRITLAQGEIIACNYRVKRGAAALEKIRAIEEARCHFSEGDITTQPDPSLPHNKELMEFLRPDMVEATPDAGEPSAPEEVVPPAVTAAGLIEEVAPAEVGVHPESAPSGASRLVFEELRKVLGVAAVELFRVEIQSRGEPETGEELRGLVKALAAKIGDAEQAKVFIAGIRQRLL